MYGNFELMDDKLFDQFVECHSIDENDSQIRCPDCDCIMMTSSMPGSQCVQCGRLGDGNNDQQYKEITSSSIKITMGRGRGKFYNITSDYSKTQRKHILDQLMRNQANYIGHTFPTGILNAAATQYNTIQKFITEDSLDDSGNICKQKKFVRRGNIKDEVLAGLIYFECIKERLVRKKRDIAAFMKLPTNGFSRGEDILRNLVAEGKLQLPVNDEPVCGFVDRYLESLGLDSDPMYSDFIIELVEESERKKIGMNSQISSKVVGCLHILIAKKGLNITNQHLEKCADNIKKNTFMKFVKLVILHKQLFSHIFAKYGITPY